MANLQSCEQSQFFKIYKKQGKGNQMLHIFQIKNSFCQSQLLPFLRTVLIQNPKVFSFEKNSKGINPPGPLSFITLDSKTEEELPSRLVSYFRRQNFIFLWQFKVCSLLVPFPRELGQCWTFPHLRINRGTLVHCQGLVLGREGHHRSLGVLPHCQVSLIMLSL